MVLEIFDSETHPRSRRMDLDSFYVTNLRFEADEMPWDEKDEGGVSGERQAEDSDSGFSDAGDTGPKACEEKRKEKDLSPASKSWLKAVGLLR